MFITLIKYIDTQFLVNCVQADSRSQIIGLTNVNDVGYGQYLISVFLLAAKTAWFWDSNPWWMISYWNSHGPCSQSPGNVSSATMPVSQPPPKLVGSLHKPKHNVTYLYNTYLDIFWRYIRIPVQWTPGFHLGEFEANLLWLLPGPWRSGRP